MIDSILETIIPTDVELQMPSAAAIGFDAYSARYGIEDLVTRYQALVETLAQEKKGMAFIQLTEEERLAIINACRTTDIRLFSAFLTHVFRAYYTHQGVLDRIGSGSTPPFPDGNSIEQDDWSILESVYERGQIFRPVEEQTP